MVIDWWACSLNTKSDNRPSPSWPKRSTSTTWCCKRLSTRSVNTNELAKCLTFPAFSVVIWWPKFAIRPCSRCLTICCKNGKPFWICIKALWSNVNWSRCPIRRSRLRWFQSCRHIHCSRYSMSDLATFHHPKQLLRKSRPIRSICVIHRSLSISFDCVAKQKRNLLKSLIANLSRNIRLHLLQIASWCIPLVIHVIHPAK